MIIAATKSNYMYATLHTTRWGIVTRNIYLAIVVGEAFAYGLSQGSLGPSIKAE